jgi:RNA polymerase sigma-70 factor, ECF subfamily
MENTEDILDHHLDALYAYARTRLDNDEDIEDCIQETLVAALKNKSTFAGRSSLRTWLIGILKFKIIDLYRVRSREIKNLDIDQQQRTEDFDEVGHWELDRGPQAWEKSPLESMEEHEIQYHLYDCIQHLPETMRTAVVFRELEQQTTTEICKQLQVTATNLNVILYRARMHLRCCLEQAGFKGVTRG